MNLKVTIFYAKPNVYRRLAQDVYGFWKAIRAEAARLAQLPGWLAL